MITIVATAVAGIVGFVLGLWKSAAEIKKLKSEIVKNSADFTEKVQESSRRYSSECQAFSRLIESLTDLVDDPKVTKTQIHAARQKLCDAFCHTLIPAFLDD